MRGRRREKGAEMAEWKAEDSVTGESIQAFLADFCSFMEIDGEGWEDIKEGILSLCLESMAQNKDLGGFYQLQDISPQVEAFYQGYMRCYRLCIQEIRGMMRRVESRYNPTTDKGTAH